MKNLLGVHAIYSISNRGSYGIDRLVNMCLAEFLCLCLSAYLWRKNNGPIKLVCDGVFHEFVSYYKLEWMWDEIDLDTLKRLPTEIDYSIFWTYPKMFVQFEQKEKFAILDADLYTDYNYLDFTEDIIYCHEEYDKYKFVYPDVHLEEPFVKIFEGFPKNLEYNAINTCFVIYNNLDILKELKDIANHYYFVPTDKLKNDTNDNSIIKKRVYYSIFCEQKVLGNIVKSKGFSYRSLLEPYNCYPWGNEFQQQWSESFYKLYSEMSNYNLQHLWVFKNNLYIDKNYRNWLTDQLIGKIETNYPELWDKIKSLKLLPPK